MSANGGLEMRVQVDPSFRKVRQTLLGGLLITSAVAALAVAATAAPTPSTLTATQLATIQSQVTSQVCGIDASITGAARTTALQAAIEKIVQTDSALMGKDAIAAVTADSVACAPATTAVDAAIRGGILGGIP